MFDSLENQQGWILTLAASLMCFIGCAVIYIDLLYSKLLPKVAATYPFSISSDGKFLISCLALSSGSLLFTSLTKLLPHASDYLASNDYLAEHTKLLNVLLLLSFLVGIGIFAGLNAVIHHFTSESIIHCSHDDHENKSDGNDELAANENNSDDSLRRLHSHSRSISISDRKYDSKTGSKGGDDYDEESAIENSNSAKHYYNNNNSYSPRKQLASSVGSSFNDDPQKTTHTIAEDFDHHHHHHHHHNNNNNSSSSSSNSEYQKTSGGLAQLTEHEDEDGNNEPTEETPLIVSMENPTVSDIHDDHGNKSDLKKIETLRGSVIKYNELQSFNALKYLKHPFSKKSQKLSLVAYSPSDKLDFGNLDQQQQQQLQRVDFKTKGRTNSSGTEVMSIDQLMLVDEDHLQQHQLHKNDHKHKHIETSVSKLFSIGIQTTLAISLHKFPEGFIYYATSKIDQSLSLNIFLSLAIHNIAEGFSMTVPLYLAMNSRFKAILITGILGSFSQPLGALLALMVLPKDPNEIDENQINLVFGCLMSLTSGFLTIIGLQMLISSLGFGGSSTLVTFWVIFGISVICFTNALTGSLL